jgi:HEAT repeat protein
MAMLENGTSGRPYAVEALGTIGYPGAHRATNEVATEAFSSHSGHRRSVANALKRIDPDRSQCVSELTRILRFVEGDGVKEASEAIAQFGSTLLPRLRELLDSENEYDRQFAFRTLWRIGTPAVDTLAEALRHDNVEVRRLAGSWLRALDAKAAPAIPDLVRALEDEDKEVRINASLSLIDIGPAAVPAVRQTLDGASARTGELVKWILSDIAAWHETEK